MARFIDDRIDTAINLQTLLVSQPASTFFIRVETQAIPEIGIFSQDILIINRSLTPQTNDVLLLVVDGMFLLRQYHAYQQLLQENSSNEESITVWGVVSSVVRQLR